MAADRINRLIWLVDTIRHYGRITRSEINRRWRRSEFSRGEDLPSRTFHAYRQAAQDFFKVDIVCDPATFEYYIASGDGADVTHWLLDTAFTREALSGAGDVADRIILEEIPSARQFLAPSITALRENRRLCLDYLPYYRSQTSRNIVIEPYCLKLFKQRWYLTGRVVGEDRIKTYALDRVKALALLPETFVSDGFDAKEYFKNAFGIVVGAGDVKKVVLRVDARQAKYFRALHLHNTQQEYVHDQYSIFHYQLRLSDDLVSELMSYSPMVTVVEPPELRAMLTTRLKQSLAAYSQ